MASRRSTVASASVPTLLILAFLLCSTFFASPIRGQSTLPPIRQSETQAAVYAYNAVIAKQSSETATPILLAYLDSDEFRNGISDIEMFQNATAQDLLAALQAVVQVTEIGHNFPPVTRPIPAMDVDIEKMRTIGFLPNYWTSVREQWLVWQFGYAYLQGIAETHIMSFPHFLLPLYPATLDEALIRPVYTCVNLQNIPGNCVAFGQTSLILNPSYVKNMTLLSPVDTGLYVSFCLSFDDEEKQQTMQRDAIRRFSRSSGISEDHVLGRSKYINCSAWDRKQGTFDNFNHLFLASSGFWNYTLSELFQRRFNSKLDTTNSPFQLFTYFEGDVVGAVSYPEAVFYVQASFVEFFGSNYSVALQEWCIENKWPLAWVDGTGSILSGLVLDPVVSSAMNGITNIQSSDQDIAMFNETFSKAATFIEQHGLNQSSTNTTFWVDLFGDLYDQLPSLTIAFTPPGSECVSDPSCFAVLSAAPDSCVCRTFNNQDYHYEAQPEPDPPGHHSRGSHQY